MCLFFISCTGTHRKMGQDSDGVQVAEDLTLAHCGHCPHGYRWSGPGVWRRHGTGLLLVKHEESKCLRKNRWEFEKENTK